RNAAELAGSAFALGPSTAHRPRRSLIRPALQRACCPSQRTAATMVNAFLLANKYTTLRADEITKLADEFEHADRNGSGYIERGEVKGVLDVLDEKLALDEVTAKLGEMRLKDPTKVQLEDVVAVVNGLRQKKRVGKMEPEGSKKVVTIGGSTETSQHTFNEDEKEQFVEHINAALGGDKDLGKRIPIEPTTMQIFDEVKDGLVLCKLINDAVNGTIDERVLNVGPKLSIYQMTENQNVCINSAKAIGLSVVNIGAQDLIEGRPHLVLGLLWQIIKASLSAKIDLQFHPELFRLLQPGETLDDLRRLPPEAILIRWFNYHLAKAGWPRKVSNLSGDVKDGENYTVLLNQLAPSSCSRDPLKVQDLMERAERVLENADKIGCRKYLTPKAMVSGNNKLNFAFVANLFNKMPGLEPLTEAEKADIDSWLFNSQGDREARAYSLWMNSLGVDPFVSDLYEDLKDGLVLLQTVDKIHPGQVQWKRVNKDPSSRFKKVENTNYAVDLGKQNKYSLVNISGLDITDGNKMLTLGLVWQMMRDHVTQTIQSLSKNGRAPDDAEMVRWANDTVKRGGKSSKMDSFRDPSLKTGTFFLDLLHGIRPGIVNYEIVTAGRTDEDAKDNAKYAISIARKLGATIFLLPEDIFEVRAKLILTFVASLMAVDLELRQKSPQ
ncbi:calponin homology domain-containing protein, partial [Hyaloraphidium curvatum]